MEFIIKRAISEETVIGLISDIFTVDKSKIRDLFVNSETDPLITYIIVKLTGDFELQLSVHIDEIILKEHSLKEDDDFLIAQKISAKLNDEVLIDSGMIDTRSFFAVYPDGQKKLIYVVIEDQVAEIIELLD